MSTSPDSKERFSSRVDDYAAYRPDYPESLLNYLEADGMDSTSAVADIGSGTGLLSRQLLSRVKCVYAVEPNAEMRRAAEVFCEDVPGFISIDGGAEHTSLPDHSVDFITSAQAFHWFNPLQTRLEFSRILKAGGRVHLIWNRRDTSDPFMKAYEEVLTGSLGTRYTSVHHHAIEKKDIEEFFQSPIDYELFPHRQVFDRKGFLGRVFSSSYTPQPQESGYREFSEHLNTLFDTFEKDGRVTFPYHTEVYSGSFS